MTILVTFINRLSKPNPARYGEAGDGDGNAWGKMLCLIQNKQVEVRLCGRNSVYRKGWVKVSWRQDMEFHCSVLLLSTEAFPAAWCLWR